MVVLNDPHSLIHGYGNTLEEATEDLRRAFHDHYRLLLDYEVKEEVLSPFLEKMKVYLKEVLQDELTLCPECGEVFSSLPDAYERKVKADFERKIREERRSSDLDQHLQAAHAGTPDSTDVVG